MYARIGTAILMPIFSGCSFNPNSSAFRPREGAARGTIGVERRRGSRRGTRRRDAEGTHTVARSIYIASPNAGTGKSTVALGLIVCLTKVVAKVGVFRPFVDSRDEDPFLNLLLYPSGSTLKVSSIVKFPPHRRRTT